MLQNPLYIEDVRHTADLDLPWNELTNKVVLVTGASGLIGRFLVDVIMYKNLTSLLNCKVHAIARNLDQAKIVFEEYLGNEYFQFYEHDVVNPLSLSDIDTVDFVFHLASNTHPKVYSTDPIGTITTNVVGTLNLLDFAVAHKTKRFVFASSNEIYGENRGDVEFFTEQYCGYIDSNTMRAGYPESKRCGESLCQAYRKQKNLEVVIPRFTRSYGPTISKNDTKAISQFISKGLAGQDVVLKSDGQQYYSYTYVGDAVSGLLTVLFKGVNGEAYNISDEASDIMLKDLALIVANFFDKKVIFQVPDEVEKLGFSIVKKARLDSSKIKKLGWKPKYDIISGVERTLSIISAERRKV